MTRRRSTVALAAAGLLLVAGCGGGGVARVAAPPLPDTTGTPMASASPSASATATPTPTAAPTATPTSTPAEGGVTRVPPSDQNGDNTVAADLYPSSGFANCPSMGSAGYGACPVTDRLAARLNQHPITGAEQLCRCQGQWQGVSITAPPVIPTVTSYTVEVDLSFGSSVPEVKFDVIVLEQSDGWYADDIQCHGGGSTTSIYASSPPHC